MSAGSGRAGTNGKERNCAEAERGKNGMMLNLKREGTAGRRRERYRKGSM